MSDLLLMDASMTPSGSMFIIWFSSSFLRSIVNCCLIGDLRNVGKFFASAKKNNEFRKNKMSDSRFSL